MKIVLFANTDWYLFNFRLSLATALREEGHDVLLVSPPGPYGERLQSFGFRWLEAPMERRSLNFVREARLILWLRRLLISEEIDLVHGFTVKCVIYSSLAAMAFPKKFPAPSRVNALAGLGYVFTSADFKAKFLKPLVRVALQFVLRGSRAMLILQNFDDVELFTKAGVDASRIRLIPGSGVDCRRFAPSRGEVRKSSRFTVVLPARLLRDKGILEYVEAARFLNSEGRCIDFLLAGEPDPGNPTSIDTALIEQWGKEGVVKILGHVSDMARLFESVDLVVLPSYREGLPKGLIEAGACGLPVVTTDVPGCRDVVTHETDGILIPPRDVPQLAHAIAHMQDNPKIRQAYGEALRLKVVEQFDERLVISRTLDVYRELMSDRRD